MKNETLNDVFTVIVLYQTSLQDSHSFNSLLRCASFVPGNLELLLYNNSPDVMLNTSVYKNQNIVCSILNDANNSGVSKAFNIACQRAEKMKKKWLLLLDQDMSLPADFFSTFFKVRINDTNDSKFLYAPIVYANNIIISPAKYIPYRGLIKKKIEPGLTSLKTNAIINSGVIIRTSLFKNAGGYNENVNLDFSDVSFFRRVQKEYSFLVVMNSKCQHAFSGVEKNSLSTTLNRYKLFIKNAIAFSKEKGVSRSLLYVTVLMHAFRLTLRFKTLKFLKETKFFR